MLDNYYSFNILKKACFVDGVANIKVELPGFYKDEVDIEINNNSLIVKAAADGKTDLKPITRTFFLSEKVDKQLITASMENGLLTITLKELVFKKKVEIS